MDGNEADIDIIVTEDTRFANLKLQWDADNGYSFEAEVLETFCDNNDINFVALLGDSEAFHRLIKAWYKACHEQGDDIDLLAEKMIETDLAAASK